MPHPSGPCSSSHNPKPQPFLTQPQDCECELYNKNECYKVQLADGRKCPAPKLTSECASRMKVGRKGDKCLQFTSPPQPPCGPGLTCVKKESLITDQGGICQPITAPKPGAKPKEGDACTFGPGQPKMCGESLTCDLEVGQSPCINPDGPCPGVCQIEFHILPIEE